jgi:hypothetical protein
MDPPGGGHLKLSAPLMTQPVLAPSYHVAQGCVCR